VVDTFALRGNADKAAAQYTALWAGTIPFEVWSCRCCDFKYGDPLPQPLAGTPLAAYIRSAKARNAEDSNNDLKHMVNQHQGSLNKALEAGDYTSAATIAQDILRVCIRLDLRNQEAI
jgi:hypothetical protein